MLSGEYDIVVLDEVNVTVWFGLLAVQEVLALDVGQRHARRRPAGGVTHPLPPPMLLWKLA